MMTTTANLRNEVRDNDDSYDDVGFMFDAFQPSTLKRFELSHRRKNSNNSGTTTTTSSSTRITVALHVVDEEPGAVQSGHYLWPAAPALCTYIMDHHDDHDHHYSPVSMIELGAGCALVSLTCLQLYKDSLQCVVITDHDPGTLERARDNYETTMEDLLDSSLSEQEQMDCINTITSIPIQFETLSWGSTRDVQQIADSVLTTTAAIATDTTTTTTTTNTEQQQQQQRTTMKQQGGEETTTATATTTAATTTTEATTTKITLPTPSTTATPSSLTTTTTSSSSSPPLSRSTDCNSSSTSSSSRIFDLVVGSDLIYDISCVEPLFVSVSLLLKQPSSSSSSTFFFLSQSFVYDDETEQEIDRICQKLQLERIILQDTLSKSTSTSTIGNEHDEDNHDGSYDHHGDSGGVGVKIQRFQWKKTKS